MEKFRCFYLDPNIEEPFSLKNSFYNKTLNPSDWFNHLFEEEVTITEVNDGDVVIKVVGVTICNTDIYEILNRGRRKENVSRRPGKIFLGHELVGVIVRTGKNVERFKKADLVCIGDFNTCKAFNIEPVCDSCKNGKGIVCTHKHRRKFTSQSYGGFSEFLVRSEQQVFKLPPGFNHQSACLIEPAALAHYCFRKIERKASNILLLGCGTIGVLLVRLIRYYFQDNVNVFCLSNNVAHLETAAASGACFVSSEMTAFEEPAKNFRSESGATIGGFDYTFDFIGQSFSINCGVQLTKPNGSIFELAFPSTPVGIDIDTLVRKEIKLSGLHGYEASSIVKNHDFQCVVELIDNELLNVNDLISRTVSFSNIKEVLINECLTNMKQDNGIPWFRTFAQT